MLDINKSQFVETLSLNVASTVTALEEGTALIHVLENGYGKVAPSTGANANEVFAGVSVSRATTPTVAPISEKISALATTITLARVPAGTVGIISVAANGTRTKLTANSSVTSATEFSRSGKTVTVHASRVGETLEVIYTYTLTHAEAVLKFNFDAFASVNLALVPVIGVVTVGVIYTDKYDVTADWSSIGGSNKLTLGADGKFTIGGSGTVVPGWVIETPIVNANGLLGVRLNG